MVALRLIPCLDVADGRVVKGVNFVGLRDAGDPVELACRYSQAGADELVFLDIAASHQGRATLVDMVRRTAEQVTIPFTVGGGISSVEGITELLRAGADKVSLNSSAVRDPELVARGADRFGCQCIVVAIDARRRQQGEPGWDVYVKGGRENTGLDVVAWARRVVTRQSISRWTIGWAVLPRMWPVAWPAWAPPWSLPVDWGKTPSARLLPGCLLSAVSALHGCSGMRSGPAGSCWSAAPAMGNDSSRALPEIQGTVLPTRLSSRLRCLRPDGC